MSRTQISNEEHLALIQAANLLGEHASKHLPAGYDIVFTMNSDECFLELVDPDGETVDDPGHDSGYATIHALCDCAHEVEKDRVQNEIDAKHNDDNSFESRDYTL